MTFSIGINLARAGLGKLWGAQAASLHLPAACRQALCKMVLGIPLGSRQAAETDRLAACAPSKSARSGMERQEARASLFNLDLARLGFTMPELAEVEYFRRQWNAGIGNRVIKIAQHADKRVFRGTDTRALRRELAGARLLTSEARGKRMLFRFSNEELARPASRHER